MRPPLPLSELRFEYFGVNMGKSLEFAVPLFFSLANFGEVIFKLYSALRSPPEVQFIDVKHKINFRAACAPTEKEQVVLLHGGAGGQKAASCTVKHRCMQILNFADGFGFSAYCHCVLLEPYCLS